MPGLILLLGSLTAAPAITVLAITPDGKAYLAGSQAGVVCRGLDGRDQGKLATALEHVLALAFAPDGKTLAVGGGSPAEDGVVELWSWPERRLLGQLEDHTDVVTGLAWLQAGKQLASSSADRTIRIWDVAQRTSVAELQGHSGPVRALAVAPDGKLLCSASSDGTIRVWEWEQRRALRVLDNHFGPVHALAFHPSQPTLASAGADGTVRIWQPGLGRMVRFVRQPGSLLGVAWNQQGDRLIAIGRDGTVRELDADGERVLRTRSLAPTWLTSLAVASQPVVGDAQGGVHVPLLERER